MEAVTDFLLLGSKITVDDYWSHGIRRRLLLGRKAMRNLDIMLKSRDITLPTNVCIVKAMVFPVVTDDCENWNVKKAEHQRIDAFELCCCWRLLRVSWTVRRSNPSILKDIDLEYSRKGLIPKLKLLYFGHLMWTADSLEKSLMLERLRAEGEEGVRGWDGWMASPRQRTWTWETPRDGEGQGGLALLQSMGLQRVGWLSDWREHSSLRASLGLRLKNQPMIWETWVWSLRWEDPLEKEMATHSSILAWIILGTEKPDRLQSMGCQKVGHDWVINADTQRHIHL